MGESILSRDVSILTPLSLQIEFDSGWFGVQQGDGHLFIYSQLDGKILTS